MTKQTATPFSHAMVFFSQRRYHLTAPLSNSTTPRNIQRGRDHGLPGYNEFRVRCGLPRLCSFVDPPRNFDIPRESLRVLASLYQHPDDVDLFVGAIAEDAPFSDSQVNFDSRMTETVIVN